MYKYYRCTFWYVCVIQEPPVFLTDNEEDEQHDEPTVPLSALVQAVIIFILIMIMAVILRYYIWCCTVDSDFVSPPLLSNLSQSLFMSGIAARFPSFYSFPKMIGLKNYRFTQYVVCQKCQSLYTYEQMSPKYVGMFVSLISVVHFFSHKCCSQHYQTSQATLKQ